MKNIVKHYLRPNREEEKQIWKDGLFIFDTNVLLNLYRYNKDTQEELLKTISEIKNKVWMPGHVAYEYMERRLGVKYDASKMHDDLRDKKREFIKCVCEKTRLKNDSPEIEELRKLINEWISKEGDRRNISNKPSEDHILERLLELFDGKVGESYSEETLSEIYEEGEFRYENEIPPGYKDKKKDDNKKYGDLVIWKQILDVSKEKKKDIIFITADQKVDWWKEVRGQTIGPRWELVKEFMDFTGHQFLMYSMETFLRHESFKIPESILDDVIEMSKENTAKALKRAIKRDQKTANDNKNARIKYLLNDIPMFELDDEWYSKIDNSKKLVLSNGTIEPESFIKKQLIHDLDLRELMNRREELEMSIATLEDRIKSLGGSKIKSNKLMLMKYKEEIKKLNQQIDHVILSKSNNRFDD